MVEHRCLNMTPASVGSCFTWFKFWKSEKLHPRNLTAIAPEKWWDWKMSFLLGLPIFGGYVKFQGCNDASKQMQRLQHQKLHLYPLLNVKGPPWIHGWSFAGNHPSKFLWFPCIILGCHSFESWFESKRQGIPKFMMEEVIGLDLILIIFNHGEVLFLLNRAQPAHHLSNRLLKFRYMISEHSPWSKIQLVWEKRNQTTRICINLE